MLDKFDSTITLVAARRQCEPCLQNDLTDRMGRLQCKQSLRNCKSTDGTFENRVYGEIVKFSEFENKS